MLIAFIKATGYPLWRTSEHSFFRSNALFLQSVLKRKPTRKFSACFKRGIKWNCAAGIYTINIAAEQWAFLQNFVAMRTNVRCKKLKKRGYAGDVSIGFLIMIYEILPQKIFTKNKKERSLGTSTLREL
jgi:hypothetical protein